MAERDRITITADEELGERFERYRKREGHEHRSEAGEELLTDALDEWERDQASYPGQAFVRRAIEVSGVGFVVGVVVAVVTAGGVALTETVMLAGIVTLFVGVHYAAILADGQPVTNDAQGE